MNISFHLLVWEEQTKDKPGFAIVFCHSLNQSFVYFRNHWVIKCIWCKKCLSLHEDHFAKWWQEENYFSYTIYRCNHDIITYTATEASTHIDSLTRSAETLFNFLIISCACCCGYCDWYCCEWPSLVPSGVVSWGQLRLNNMAAVGYELWKSGGEKRAFLMSSSGIISW